MINLYEKYKADQYKNLPALNPLSFILTKAELAKNLTPSQWQWLEQHYLFDTINVIKSQENYRSSLHEKVINELSKLWENRYLFYKVRVVPNIDSEVALVLYKVNTQERLSITEAHFVNDEYHQILDFNEKKQRYGIFDDFPFNPKAESILSKFEQKIQFSVDDLEWIYKHNYLSFLNVLKNQFSLLQSKYKADAHDDSVINNMSLYLILQKLEEEKHLDESEFQYLKENGFDETINIAQQIEFANLKQKYQATQIQEDNANSHLYKVLKKLEAGISLPEPDVNFLKKRKLIETLKFVLLGATKITAKIFFFVAQKRLWS